MKSPWPTRMRLSFSGLPLLKVRSSPMVSEVMVGLGVKEAHGNHSAGGLSTRGGQRGASPIGLAGELPRTASVFPA